MPSRWTSSQRKPQRGPAAATTRAARTSARSSETVTLRRAEKLDPGFLRLATESFEDWNTPEAEDAFRDL